VIGKWVTEGIDPGHFVVLAGDLDTIMDKLDKGDQPYKSPWIEDLGLMALLADILLPMIDYQMHSSGIDRNPSRIDHASTRALPPPSAARKSALVMTSFWMILAIAQSRLDLSYHRACTQQVEESAIFAPRYTP
jgi:hypothetical protein